MTDLKPQLLWRVLDVNRGDHARIFLNGEEAKWVVRCGPFWIEQFIRHGNRWSLSDNGSRINTQIRVGIVRWLPLERS